MADVHHLEFKKKFHIWSCHRVLKCDVVYHILSKSDDFSLRRFNDLQYGGRRPSWIFEIIVYTTWPILLPCAKFHWSRTIDCWVVAILNFKNFHFGHLAVTEFQMYSCVPNFIKIGWFLPRDVMRKRGLCRHAVSVSLFIRLSATFVYSEHICNFFYRRVDTPF